MKNPNNPCRVEHNFTPNSQVVIVNRNVSAGQVIEQLNERRERVALVKLDHSREETLYVSTTGVVTVADLLDANPSDPVGEISNPPITIEYKALMTKAKQKLKENKVKELVVTDEAHNIIHGIILDFQIARGCP